MAGCGDGEEKNYHGIRDQARGDQNGAACKSIASRITV